MITKRELREHIDYARRTAHIAPLKEQSRPVYEYCAVRALRWALREAAHRNTVAAVAARHIGEAMITYAQALRQYGDSVAFDTDNPESIAFAKRCAQRALFAMGNTIQQTLQVAAAGGHIPRVDWRDLRGSIGVADFIYAPVLLAYRIGIMQDIVPHVNADVKRSEQWKALGYLFLAAAEKRL